MKGLGSNNSEKVGLFQIAILVLSIVVLGALGADMAFKLPKQVSEILQNLDTTVCVLLFVDFWIRFYKAESKLAFIKWGWIDLVASIPNIPVLRVGRFVRILRVIRLLRAIRATQKISSLLLKDKIQTGITSVVLSAFLLIIFCSIAILICEQQDPNANIKTAGDAIWWSVSTITTVGYGDTYPVTGEGRIVAMILMVSGIGLFGVLSGCAASFFVGSKEKSIVREENKILAQLEKLEEKIDQLKRNQ
ncbi:MAG TPA: ion transporter [Candidatus Sulfotelmatobacter sp.]|jgi:voltage-gated potassium channel|nr:ion transporter [Candidatus Sulfotelmatobacter sp.]